MYLRETVKQMTGRGVPDVKEVRKALRSCEPEAFRFKDDGVIPNNPALPMLLYPRVIGLAAFADPAAAFEELFRTHGWGESWRNGIYDYVHYHARIHEVLGVARGQARVRFGGERGEEIEIAAGDVAVLPAGTGHDCLVASGDFLVVGAYPPDGTYDECRGSAEEHAQALKTIPQVALPHKDPVFGATGPLRRFWQRR